MSMPSRAYTSFLHWCICKFPNCYRLSVNALSGLYIISTWRWCKEKWHLSITSCQCPLGLIHHFYLQHSSMMRNRGNLCQCPLGLIHHFYLVFSILTSIITGGVNALSGLYIISTSSTLLWLWRKVSVSMPSRAYTSFLRYPFKNLGFMRLPEPVFAGIYQNILTTAVFRAC